MVVRSARKLYSGRAFTLGLMPALVAIILFALGRIPALAFGQAHGVGSEFPYAFCNVLGRLVLWYPPCHCLSRAFAKEDRMTRDGCRGLYWAGLPVIATVARLLCRELTLGNEYLRSENQVLKSKVRGRICFKDNERWLLMKAALAMGRKLMRRAVTIVKPDTILAWQRRLEQRKWDYSRRRRRGPGRPRTSGEVEVLVCRLARENTWGYKRIQGELKKLGITLSKSCIADILRRNGLPPAPERRVVALYRFHFNDSRPHQGLANRVPREVRAGEPAP
ncbi:hypothetical protein ACFLU6_04295 [Acidobacteriota bacterium]